MESLVHMREACARAVQGDEYEFNRALRRAHNLYAEPQEDDPAWLGFYGAGEVTGLERRNAGQVPIRMMVSGISAMRRPPHPDGSGWHRCAVSKPASGSAGVNPASSSAYSSQ